MAAPGTDRIISFCSHCGAHLDADARFCASCGHPFAVAPVPSSVGFVGPTAAVAAVPAAPPVAPVGTPFAGGPPPADARAGSALVIVLGALASLALLAAIGALVLVLRSGGDGGPEIPSDTPAVTSAPAVIVPSSTSTSTATSTSTTTATTPTTTTTAPPVTTAAPPPTPVQAPEVAGQAVAAVQGAMSQCGQGGSVAPFDAVEVRAGVYHVSAPVTFEGATESVTVTWEVDFTTGSPQVRALDEGAAALICLST